VSFQDEFSKKILTRLLTNVNFQLFSLTSPYLTSMYSTCKAHTNLMVAVYHHVLRSGVSTSSLL